MGLETVSFELLATWPILLIALMWWDRRHGRLPLFIVYAYIAGLAVNHWFGGLVHLYPTDASEFAVATGPGFDLSTWGLVFLVLGAAVYPRVRVVKSKQRTPHDAGVAMIDARRAVTTLVIMGLGCWVAELTPIGNVPSAGAIIAGGKQLLIAAICLKCWLAWRDSDRRTLYLWLSLGFAFPLYTMLFLGFLGYGISYLMSILIFVGTFYRPRWRVFAAGLIAIYAGLSVYIGYAANRTQIREAVWGGRSMEVRVDAALKMMDDIAPFDPFNPEHQHMIDQRLNQNWLVGESMSYVPGFRSYADGETLYVALIALVPRAVWPDKPFTGGSGNLVRDYTGITFAEGTSVGVGQVMEFYINFGWTGVAVGFFLLGLALRFIDVRVNTSIRDQAWADAGLWFAVGLSTMQQIGQLAEITTSVAAAAVFGMVALKVSQRMAARRARRMAGPPRVPVGMPIAEPPGFRRHQLPNQPDRRLP